MVLETLESPLDSKEVNPVSPKGNQPWIFIERTVAEADAPILWPHDAKSWLTGKCPDARKDWRQEEKQGQATDNETIGGHHWLNAHEFDQNPGDSGRHGSLACCSPRGLQRVRYDLVTEQQNWHLPYYYMWILQDQVKTSNRQTLNFLFYRWTFRLPVHLEERLPRLTLK